MDISRPRATSTSASMHKHTTAQDIPPHQGGMQGLEPLCSLSTCSLCSLCTLCLCLHFDEARCEPAGLRG
eukprot:1625508-Prymnesium_polylepis.1